MILAKDGVIESPVEPVKNRRKYWLNTTTNQMNVLKNNKYELLNKPINVVPGVEFKTGKLENGKEEWCKRINTGALPNNKQNTFNVGFDTVANPIHKIEGYARSTTKGDGKCLPHININKLENSIQAEMWTGNILMIATKVDYSNFDTSHVDLYFTKS